MHSVYPRVERTRVGHFLGSRYHFPSGNFDFYENYLPSRNVSLFAGCVKPPHVLHCINSMQMHRIQAPPFAGRRPRTLVGPRASTLHSDLAGLACQENNLHASIALPREFESLFGPRKRGPGERLHPLAQ
jgi:hypothetical protein